MKEFLIAPNTPLFLSLDGKKLTSFFYYFLPQCGQ